MFEPTAIYAPNPHRYDTMTYNRAGTSGLKLPAVSLGFWHNFGDITPFDQMKSLVFTAYFIFLISSKKEVGFTSA